MTSSKWIRPMHSVTRCRPRRIRSIAYADTFYSQDVYSGSGIRAKAGIAEGQPRRAGPDAEAPRSGPGSGPSETDPGSAVGGEVQAKKAAVILPKPRVAPVQQPAVKHEEAVPAQKTAVKSEEAVPVQKPTVQEASPTPAEHRSSASRTFGCPS